MEERIETLSLLVQIHNSVCSKLVYYAKGGAQVMCGRVKIAMFRNFCLIISLFLCCSSAFSVEKTRVKVGGYTFAPFVQKLPGEKTSGLTLDLIELMNRFQDAYQFEFVLIDSKHRYRTFEAGRFDLIFFENKAWGWTGYDLDSTKAYLTGGEVYIAKAKAGRGQEYFSDFSSKRMVGMEGYHYKFANFNSDPKYLKKHFNMQLVNVNSSSIRMILSGRGDVAVLTQSYLQAELKKYPHLRDELLVSDKMDQVYNHTILIRNKIQPDTERMNELLKDMNEAGVLPALWTRYGVNP